MSKPKLIKFEEYKQFPNTFDVEDTANKGQWRNIFGNDNPIVIELACGKGDYTVGLARMNPEVNYIGIDIKSNRMWTGAKAALDEKLTNVRFLRTHIDHITEFFDTNEVDEIWITFPDPQLRLSKAKKRLTHPQFLRLYQKFLTPGGIVHLKTDSPNLYLFTKTVIELYGLTLITATDDVYGTAFMHSDKWDERCAIKTYYEGLNIASSNRIHYIQFKIDAPLPIAKDETLKEMIAEFEVTETHDAKRERGVKANEN